MPTSNVPGQSHLSFPGSTLRHFSIRIRRLNPFGAANFVVYETHNKNNIRSAGSCPALSAVPNYIEVIIPQNVPYTVQALDGDLTVEEPANI
ncbi:hypothetical protein WKR88_26550 [Trinickia caryophylli]|uniref:Uncharacterized protein n=1 Tax=Trinickia caryophylli TaxID=28094 RepID=A0A1X7G2A1_TRICW|nr:hypothetical protein [Trinickia caryophylli]TRX14191.1 hypothetical protein FNF07_23055 [Trinickia caryophylli]WQE14015.1 hypothetical protein U0034_25265 [Trinickia caryophylli]GLU33499.1 hypothetical protein Busp01_33410 [Trinickia caryophylli]SMF62715.1 hypothetical protein SAMN06295900_11329 [Trinickia caryophylli]